LNKTALVLALIASLIPVSAQQDLHVVRFPEGDSAWTVEIEALTEQARSASGGQDRRSEKIEVVRKGNFRRDKVTWSDGTSSEYWWVLSPELVLFRAKPGEPLFPIRGNQIGTRRYDEGIFTWVKEETFVADNKDSASSVRQYRVKLENDGSVGYFTAEVDAGTNLPISWSDGVVRARFHFKPPPTEALQIPAEYRAELEGIAERLTPAKPLGKR
jgi:hypothetical protein